MSSNEPTGAERHEEPVEPDAEQSEAAEAPDVEETEVLEAAETTVAFDTPTPEPTLEETVFAEHSPPDAGSPPAPVEAEPQATPLTGPTPEPTFTAQSSAASSSAGPTFVGQQAYTAPTEVPVPVAPVMRSRGPRAGTVVWGLVIMAVGIVLIAIASGARIDLQLAFIVLLTAAGLALLTSAIVSASRRGRRDRSRGPRATVTRD